MQHGNRKGRRAAMVVSLAFTLHAASVAADSEAVASVTGMLDGFGEAAPHREDISKHPDYQVFKWEAGETTIIQVNDRYGTPLSAHMMQPGAEPTDMSDLVVPADVQDNDEDGDGQCPCSGETVAERDDFAVIVVTDQNGNVIEVVTIQFEQQ